MPLKFLSLIVAILLFSELAVAQSGPGKIPVVSIAEAKELPVGTLVTIESVTITSKIDTIESSFFGNFRVEDETAAITIFGDSLILSSFLSDLEQGDVINITGPTGCFAGLDQINQLEDPSNFSIFDTDVDVVVNAPTNISTTDLADNSSTAEALESKLVSLNNVTFLEKSNLSAPGEPFASVANYLVTDGKNTVEIRVSTTSIANHLGSVPTGPTRIIGAFNQFADCEIDDTGYQILIFDLVILGDVDGNGVVSLLDVAPFVDALAHGEFAEEADINGDGVVDLLDVAQFVDLLTSG